MSVPAQEATWKTDAAPPSKVGAFRADVEGLRAVAIALVVLFHAGWPVLHGGFVGVDVFFVISGFLITTQLVGELDRTGRISIAAFYGRRARRILPAASVVLVVSTVVEILVDTRLHWRTIGGDIVASALYVVNWRIKDRLVNVRYDDPLLTPISHFWSLAIEEQFYLVWPFLMIVAALLAGLLGARRRRLVWLALSAVAVASLAWSIRDTAHSADTAYYSTLTRVWELALGGGVALGAERLARLPRDLAVILGWVGLGAVIVSGAVFTKYSAWPGYLAAVPTLGTAAVIAAGFTAAKGAPALILSTRPVRWLGRLSYSLYLWHWPMLYAAAGIFGGLAPATIVAAIAASVLLAWLSYTLVENPVRRSEQLIRSSGRALTVGLSFTLLGVAAGAILIVLG